MSDPIDLTADDDAGSSPSQYVGRKRKAEEQALPECVWVAIHQLEAQYHGIGDFSDHRGCLSHNPKTFDATILGVYTTRSAANVAARRFCLENVGWYDDDEDDEDEEDEDEEEEDPEEDFVGKGRFLDGSESGDVNTFSERVFVLRQTLHR